MDADTRRGGGVWSSDDTRKRKRLTNGPRRSVTEEKEARWRLLLLRLGHGFGRSG